MSLNDDVAEIYAKAKPNSLCFRSALVVASHSPLDRGSALDSVDDTCEFDQRTVAHELHNTTTELRYRWIDQLSTASL